MSQSDEIALLRQVSKNLVRRPSVFDAINQAYLRGEGFGQARQRGDGVVALLREGQEAFNKLSKCVVRRSPAMKRGTTLANVETELFDFLATRYIDAQVADIGISDVAQMHEHFAAWFGAAVGPMNIFVPCVISPWQSPRFSIGPVEFTFIDDVRHGDPYLRSGPDILGRKGFEELLRLMRETHASWLACVPVLGCEQKRAEELAALAVDVAIVAIQLAAPGWGTSNMSRLDSRRGFNEKRTLVEAGGYFTFGWTRNEPGMPIGKGTLADIVQRSQPVMIAVGNFVRSFTTAEYRLPKLEQAWCDAAYWLHQGLAEPLETISVAKLETAIEVLTQAESAAGSRRRILAVLEAFFGLTAASPMVQGYSKTAEEFARDLVRDRSRILHGTWSTLNSQLAADREGLQNFLITLIRSAATNLDEYAAQPDAMDDVERFLAWVIRRRQDAKARCG